MDYGKQTSLTDALCAAILRQGDMPTEEGWRTIKGLAEKVREGKQYDRIDGGMDYFDRAFLRATGRAL